MEVTDAMFFLSHNNIPENRSKVVTYGKTVVDYRPLKDDPYFIHLTVGINLINIQGGSVHKQHI